MNTEELGYESGYDERSDQIRIEMERDRRQMQLDLEDAFRVILDYLPAEWGKDLKDAVEFVRARGIGS